MVEHNLETSVVKGSGPPLTNGRVIGPKDDDIISAHHALKASKNKENEAHNHH